MSAGQRRRLSNPDGRAQFLYESGDISQALQLYNLILEELNSRDDRSPARQHNLALLTYLVNAKAIHEEAFFAALKDMYFHSRNSTNRVTLETLVLSHNLALSYLVRNQPEEGMKLLLPLFDAFSENDDEQLDDMKSKVSFLLIDCVISLSRVTKIDEVLEWLEKFIAKRNGENADSAIEIKFRFHCYKSRCLFLKSSFSNDDDLEIYMKSARKELKNAMEIYHNELAVKTVGKDKQSAESVQDSVTDTVNSSSNDQNRDVVTVIRNGGMNGELSSYPSAQIPDIRSSDSLNQHALYLKANLEHLKGNSKKALKLCSEAEVTIDRQIEDLSFDNRKSFMQAALHNNNIAAVHQAAGNVYLAMHHYSHAITYIEKMESLESGIMFEGDGTIKQIPMDRILYNAAVCAHKVENFASAYECMSRCIELSPDIFAKCPLSWLLLGEICVGLITQKSTDNKIWSCDTEKSFFKEASLKAVGYLNKCIMLCLENPNEYVSCLESARLHLGFIFMEAGNPVTVINLMNEVLNTPCNMKDSSETDFQLSNQRRATARLYACEAMCLMGDIDAGLQYLSRGKKDEEVLSELMHLTDQLVLKDQMRDNGESETILHLNQLSAASTFALKGDITRAVDIVSTLIQTSSDAHVLSSAKLLLLICSSNKNFSHDKKV